MPLRLKQPEAPAQSLRRMCRSRVGRARKRLIRDGSPASVHGVRKEIKRVRAALRLMDDKSGDKANRKAAKALRQAADCLAASRDARVMLRAFEKLTGDEVKIFPRLHESLRKHCRREARNLQADEQLLEAAHLLRKARRKFRTLKIRANDWTDFNSGLKHSFSRGKEMFKVARREPASENLHRWRKRIKNLWYQLCLLRFERSGAARVIVDKLERLGDQLGEEHDLALLKEFVLRCGVIAERKALGPLIDARCDELRRQVLVIGGEIFSGETILFASPRKRERIVRRKQGRH